MTATVSSTEQAAAVAAANAVPNGQKNAAYLNSIRTSMGSNYKRVLYQNGVAKYSVTTNNGQLVLDGNKLVVSPATGVSPSVNVAASLSSGTWVHRIEKASDANVYIESEAGAAGSGKACIVTPDLDGNNSVTIGVSELTSPAFDTSGSGTQDGFSEVTLTFQHISDQMVINHQPPPSHVSTDPIWGQPFTVTAGGFIFKKIRPEQEGPWTYLLPWGVVCHYSGGPTGTVSGLWVAVKNIQWRYRDLSGNWHLGGFASTTSPDIHTADQSYSIGAPFTSTTIQTNPYGASNGNRIRVAELGRYSGVYQGANYQPSPAGKGHGWHHYNGGGNWPTGQVNMLWTGYQVRLEGDSQAILDAQKGNANLFAYAGADAYNGGINLYETHHGDFTPIDDKWRWVCATSVNQNQYAKPTAGEMQQFTNSGFPINSLVYGPSIPG